VSTGITVTGLSKSFGRVQVLSDIDVVIPNNSLCALLGPSGSGKSTLLRVIAGFERPNAGRVFLGGTDVTDVPLGKREVGFVFQSYALFPHLNVADNVAFPLSVRKRRAPKSTDGFASCSNSSGSRPSRSGFPVNYPAVSASESRSLERWLRSPRYSFSTSPLRHSTSRSAEICVVACANCTTPHT
jgi:ABC-type sugar transport system ATPase subunit